MRPSVSRVLIAFAFCLACSSPSPPPTSQTPTPTTFGATPISPPATSTSGAYVVTMYSAATGLVQGLDTVEIVVTDAQSMAPVDGLTINVVPWMPAMGHGTSVVPQITPMGNGKYVATDVVLFMAGTWQLRTNLTSAETAIVTVEIS